jgi:hypothetical protein
VSYILNFHVCSGMKKCWHLLSPFNQSASVILVNPSSFLYSCVCSWSNKLEPIKSACSTSEAANNLQGVRAGAAFIELQTHRGTFRQLCEEASPVPRTAWLFNFLLSIRVCWLLWATTTYWVYRKWSDVAWDKSILSLCEMHFISISLYVKHTRQGH